MRHISVRTMALAGVLLLAACGGESQSTQRSDETTQSLLDQTRTVAGSRPRSDLAMPSGDPEAIDVATLGFDRGDRASPVRVVEMSDYGCGFCRKFHMETLPTLLDDFVETGKVEWKFVTFITGMFENSLAASEAAECALEQGREYFLTLDDRLWVDQSEWKRSNEPEAVVRSWVAELGIDMTDFDSCVSEDRRLERVAAATSLARQLGVRATPTFFVVGYPPLQGALPTETFQEILNAVHADATSGGGN